MSSSARATARRLRAAALQGIKAEAALRSVRPTLGAAGRFSKSQEDKKRVVIFVIFVKTNASATNCCNEYAYCISWSCVGSPSTFMDFCGTDSRANHSASGIDHSCADGYRGAFRGRGHERGRGGLADKRDFCDQAHFRGARPIRVRIPATSYRDGAGGLGA